MGRVSKHRKTKSCDPFYKGKKTDKLPIKTKKDKTHIGDRVIEEQKMPRTMKNIFERAKQLKEKKKKLKRLDVGNKKLKTKKQLLFQQQKGESKSEYFNRIDREAASAVVESMKKNRKMSERRKSHLKKRKEKEKIKKNPERALSTVKEFSDFKDEVTFGNVVSQPPTLTAKPRKAPLEAKGTKSLLLHSKIQKENQTTQSTEKQEKTDDKNSIPKSKKRKHMTPFEKAALDKERTRVIEAYRAAKKKALGDKGMIE